MTAAPSPTARRRLLAPAALALLPMAAALLAGCGPLLSASTSDVAGIASAGVAGSVTESAAIGTGIGLAVAAIADSGLEYGERKVHAVEQARIAEAAGALEPGGVAPWSVGVRPPVEGPARGEVAVVSDLDAAAGLGLACKGIVFSVEGGGGPIGGRPRRAFYTATVCRDDGAGGAWRWASAEPATERWGKLQ